MKLLRTTISFFLYLCMLFTAVTPTAAKSHTAQAAAPQTGTYACILEENTLLCAAREDSTGLFYLPTTYYVKLVEYGERYCKVEYLYDDAQAKKQLGYVRTEKLTFVDYLPKQPYFYHVFSVSYRIEENDADNEDVLNEITVSCTYYGDYLLAGKTYCYVLQNGSFGYVPKPTELTVPENTEHAEYLASLAPDPTEEPASQESSSPAQIAILVALCLLVPLLAALILKPPRRPPYETE